MKNFSYCGAGVLILLLIPFQVLGQISMTQANLLLDFSGYEGAGFADPPAAGQLDASAWLVSETQNLARGMTSGGETGAGIYAYAVPGDTALWIQAIGTYFTPGSLTLLIQNNTTAPLTNLSVSYELLVLNDQNRANQFNFLFSEDNLTFLPQPSLDFTSPQLADLNPQVKTYPKGISLSGLNIPIGNTFALQWVSDDVAGAGSRDEFGINNIRIYAGPPIIASELRFMNLPARLVRGQAFECLVCATNASGQVAVGNATPIQLTEISATGTTIMGGIQGAGCRTFTLTPSAIGPLSLRSTNGTFVPLLSGNIPIDPGSVFLSEYIEGSGSNRCLEIFNASGLATDLTADGYEIRIYNSGSLTATPSDIYPLYGSLAAGEVHVICNENAGPDFLGKAKQTAPEPDFVFSGDEVIELRNAQGSLDFIGRLGEDPGFAWTGGGVSTENASLTRKASINFGDNDPYDAFDPSVEWEYAPKNTWAYLGSHNINPIATELRIRRFEGDSSNCWSEQDYVALEVCAYDAIRGFNQVDFPAPITLNSNGTGPFEIAGLHGGNSRNVDNNGCATFYFRNFQSETLTLTASAPGVSPISSPPFSISPTCPDPRMIQTVINPCGNEAQNEFLSLINGDTPLNLADMTLASLDHLSGSPQANYNYTFNSTGTATPDNPKPCNNTDNVCLAWLNVQVPAQRQMLINLRDELNAISPCPIFEIPLQTPGTFGEIPAHARMMVFLGAGGNGNLGTEGFDDALNNLDFSAFCASGLQNIYLIASTRKIGFGGYFHNQDARTVRLILQGNIHDVQGSDPAGDMESEFISHTGEYMDNQSCVPAAAFPVSLLSIDHWDFRIKTHEARKVELEWEIVTENPVQFFIIERRHESEVDFKSLTQIPARENLNSASPYQYQDTLNQAGRYIYRIKTRDFNGNIHYSPSRETWIQVEPAIYDLSVFTQTAYEQVSVSFISQKHTSVQVIIYNLAGQSCLAQTYQAHKGKNRLKIPVSSLAEGYYLLEVQLNGMRIAVDKMLLR